MIVIGIDKRQAWAVVNFHWRSTLCSWCLVYQLCEYYVVIRSWPWQNRFGAFLLLRWFVSVLAQETTFFEAAFFRLLSAFELKSLLSRRAHTASMMVLHIFANNLKCFFICVLIGAKYPFRKKIWIHFLVVLLWLVVFFFLKFFLDLWTNSKNIAKYMDFERLS